MSRIDQLIKENKVSAMLLLVIRFYLGWKWLDAGWGKLTSDKAFDASGYLKNAVENSSGAKPTVQGWWGDFVGSTVLPNVNVINILIPWGELLVGISLILGLFTVFGACMGGILNFTFFLSGSISSIPQMLLCAFVIIYAGRNSGYFGLGNLYRHYMPKKSMDKQQQLNVS
ncbi:DoxX family membrane protein [Paenibacillus sp. MMS18-CY102]|uniref:DoxX family membrane protein n=1 Tax=Paenibacillus sp. MMS18-CY102 TaxID=2682849 RepID=UPI0013664EC1|nr:DoxX family protein [Paenibacillus sp. MMS18-CY102]MWC28638.1 DoxX family membrane protein [Paenibacillus sp. MMS18-CY102]